MANYFYLWIDRVFLLGEGRQNKSACQPTAPSEKEGSSTCIGKLFSAPH
jgi:hypothetical protein